MNIEWWMIDGIVCLIVLVAAILGAARGIGDTVIKILGIAAGLALGFFYSGRLAEYISGTKINTVLHDHIFQILSSGGAPGLTETQADENSALIESITNPNNSFGEGLSKSLGVLFTSAADRAAEAASIKLTGIAVSIIAFALIVIGVSLICAILRVSVRHGRKKSAMLGFTDRTLGFVLGTVRGLILAWIAIAVMIPVAALFSPESVPGMMQALQETTVSKVIYDVNPFLLLVRYMIR